MYLPLVANKSFSRLVLEVMSTLSFIIFDLHGKRFESFSKDYFLEVVLLF